jgi:hypothetical protein
VTCRSTARTIEPVKKLLLMILILAVIPAAVVVGVGLAYGFFHNLGVTGH